MTATIDHLLPAESAPTTEPGASDGPTWAEVHALEERIERQARSSTAWAFTTCAVAAVALLFGVIAIGWGSRAIDESRHGVRQAAAPMAPMAPMATTPVAPMAVAVSPVAVRLDDFQVLPAAAAIRAGTVTLQLSNAGKVAHELLVFRTDLDPAAYPIKDGGLDEEGGGMTKISDGEDIEPGATQNRTVDLTQPGSYLFVCNLPGHFTAGMYSVVNVR